MQECLVVARQGLGGQGGEGIGARRFDLLNFTVDLFQRFPHGRHYFRDGLAAQFEISAGCLLSLCESGGGKLEECLIVAGQRVRAQGCEGVGGVVARVLDQRDLFGGGAALGIRGLLAERARRARSRR